MILSDTETFDRLGSEDNIINLLGGNVRRDMDLPESSVLVKPLNDTGRGDRGPAVSDHIRRLIAQTTNATDETKTEVATVFGVGVPLVSQVSRGLVHNRLDKELQDLSTKTASEKTANAHESALDSLVASLGLVNTLLPEATSLKEATRTAVQLAQVVKTLRPEEQDGPKAKTLVVINMPNLKKESQFETIDV